MESIDQNGVEVIMLTPEKVQARITEETAYVVNVREPNEHIEARISGSTLNPLSTFDASQIQIPTARN